MAVFLVIGLVFLGLGAFSPKARGEIAAFGPQLRREASVPRSPERGVFGGPASGSEVLAGPPERDKTMLASQPAPDPAGSLADISGNLPDQDTFRATALQGTPGAGSIAVSGSAKPSRSSANEADLSDSKIYFVLPTQGFNWGKLHPQNAVDIANSCGAPVVASAQGLVADFSLDSWGGGYGHYIIIAHPNGTKTRYAHLNTVFVALGQYVKQNDLIGTVGRTGDATGCHVHFEVEGAANPFARQRQPE